jgi:prevent-host-death family protein
MSKISPYAERLSVTEAAGLGIPAVIRTANSGQDVVIENRGKPQAVVVSMDRLAELEEFERDLQSAALILSRAATDNGNRTDLDKVMATFGFDPKEIRAAAAKELRASRRKK